MKTKIVIVVIIGTLLTSCGAEIATQEIKGATEAPVSEVSMTQESVVVVTEEPVETDTPTEAPTQAPLACVTLLMPQNGTDLPVTGKVTFSWTPLDEAESYVLNFILPSGQSVSFTTDQTFRDRYMEAFVTGGEYQWQVVTKGADGSEICVSEMFTFEKPAYEQPKKPEDGGKDEGNNDDDGSDGGDGGCTDLDGCGGEQ